MHNLETIKAWCEIFDPKQPQNIDSIENITNKFFSSPQIAVQSNAIVIGTEVDKEKEKSLEIKKIIPKNGNVVSMPEEEYQKLLKKFKETPASGCTTILDMARIKANFNPIQPLKEGNLQAYNKYISEVLRCPFFHIEISDAVKYERKEKNWDKAIDDIVNLYEGIDSSNKEQIRKSLISLTKSATSRKDTKQCENLFVQNTLELKDEIKIYIYYSSVALKEHSGKSTSRQTNLNIVKTKLRFYKEYWENYAETVMKKHIKSIDDWLEDNSTPEGNEPHALTCLREYKNKF